MSAIETTERFTVIVSDKTFELTKAQLEHDAPNSLTSYFLDENGECINKKLELLRDPKIFELVVRYLNGYQIVPLDRHLIPHASTAQRALADIRADADFFQLRGLLRLCETYSTVHQYVVVTTYSSFLTTEIVSTDPLSLLVGRCSLTTYEDHTFKAVSKKMTVLTNKNAHKEKIYLKFGWLQTILKEFFKDTSRSAVSRWELLGWKSKSAAGWSTIYHSMFVKLWY
ncbi:hypothetical protein RhiJN_10919 [Ceratobasidium sp. AG-Ba]|nr:hypothetical protein RhiJN_10919 [Ceratobasidium sp. AG-Ba]QRW11651.1 hypothetical protein RhiLY_10650 [Ceratobasidium sp. AG-Ba]